MKNLGKTTSFTYCTLTLTTCCKDSKQFPVSFHIPGLSERGLLKGVFETSPPGKESECEPSRQPGSCSCGILPLLTGEKWPFWFITEIFPWFQCVKWGMCPGASYNGLGITFLHWTHWLLTDNWFYQHRTATARTSASPENLPFHHLEEKSAFPSSRRTPLVSPAAVLPWNNGWIQAHPKRGDHNPNSIPSGSPQGRNTLIPCWLAAQGSCLSHQPGCVHLASALVLLDPRVAQMERKVFGNKRFQPLSKFLHNVLMEAEQADKQHWGVAVASGKYSQWTSNFTFNFFVISSFSCTWLNALNWLWWCSALSFSGPQKSVVLQSHSLILGKSVSCRWA